MTTIQCKDFTEKVSCHPILNGGTRYDLVASIKALNDWKTQQEKDMQIVSVISVETLFYDLSSTSGYQPGTMGIRVWYMLRGA
jgi:hypothetical protein